MGTRSRATPERGRIAPERRSALRERASSPSAPPRRIGRSASAPGTAEVSETEIDRFLAALREQSDIDMQVLRDGMQPLLDALREQSAIDWEPFLALLRAQNEAAFETLREAVRGNDLPGVQPSG